MIFLGYIFTAVLATLLLLLFWSVAKSKSEIINALREKADKKMIIFLLGVLLFFLIFSLLFVSPTEQLYFDENIYQGIAINILSSGNALWCQYGTGFLQTCFNNAIYHDLVGYPFLLAISFAIFGIGVGTAFATQLFIGLLAITFFFLLSLALFDKKLEVIASTVTFSLIPQLFIWSRTQAIPDLALMAFATLTFFFFVIFAKKPKLDLFMAFASSLFLTIYMRIEGVLLIPMFFVLFFLYGNENVASTIKSRISLALESINNNTKFLLVGLIFLLLAMPDFYYLALQITNPSYGQDYTNQQVFSVANFLNNISPNVMFFFGAFNSINQYPLGFPLETTLLAIFGVFLILISNYKNKWGILSLLGIWILSYHLFYDFFYAGAATFGVDDRFMLQMVPAISLLAGFAIGQASEIFGRLAGNHNMGLAIYAIFMIMGLLLPFYLFVPNITLKPYNMPQQTIIYDAISFFYANYNKVPTNCFVYSFTPDIWYETGRAAAQIDYLNSNNAQFLNDTKSYSCRVIDFGYWCSVPPYKGTTCRTILQNQNLIPLASYNNSIKGENFAFYQIKN